MLRPIIFPWSNHTNTKYPMKTQIFTLLFKQFSPSSCHHLPLSFEYSLQHTLFRARCTVVGWVTMLQTGSSRVRFQMRSLDFQLTYPFQPHYGPGVDSASNRNEYQDCFWRYRASGSWGWQPRRHLWADCLEYIGTFTSQNPMGLHGLLQG
jgi:hypothetical protein